MNRRVYSTNQPLIVFVLSVIFVSVGCGVFTSRSESWVTPTPSPDPQYTPGEVIPDTGHLARFILGQQLQVSPEEISVKSVESVTWPDSCLGISLSGQSCDPIPVVGYRITLDVFGDLYVFHTDQVNLIHLASAPNGMVDDAVLEWTNTSGVCTGSIIDFENISFGECGAPMITTQLFERGTAQDLRYFWETYASFTSKTHAGDVVFSGQGQTEATMVEQRMIAEWAKMTTMIAQSGRAGAAWGLIIAWRQNNCDYLNVFITGIALIDTCQSEGNQPQIRTRLTAKQLEVLFDWNDRFSPLELTQSSLGKEEDFYFLFSGKGHESISIETQQAMLDFSLNLFEKMTSP